MMLEHVLSRPQMIDALRRIWTAIPQNDIRISLGFMCHQCTA